ncbi:MAG: S41 family peptidase [Flammeovirgaceae bacterium]
MKKNTILGILCLLLCSLYSSAQNDPLWMRYSAISPDGQAIVFTYKGDLYRVPATGGMAVPLTIHEAYDFNPVWSHDGKFIAFASDRYGNFDVFVMPATGGEAVRLTYHSSYDMPSDFTPDNKSVIFSSLRRDIASNAQFPNGAFPELYKVPANGGRVTLVSTNPANNARYNKDGSMLVYHDRKGYEDNWRKHHTSSVTRDIWTYDLKKDSYQMLTTFNGEDRDPHFSADGKSIYYLSESSGSFNIHKMGITPGGDSKQLTSLKNHPIRFLTKSDADVFCFSYNGEIYTMKEGDSPQKVVISILTDGRSVTHKIKSVRSGASEYALSPNGKEIAFVYRGEVFVAPVEGGDTKRITNTPEQERTISFSPDGKRILYASERNNNWNVYQTSIVRKEEPYFYASTILEEDEVIASAQEEFQPAYSPDGKEVAYLEERTTLRVVNLESKQTRTILDGNLNYSYADGDQHYEWSPDGKWFLVNYNLPNHWIGEVGLIASDGKGEVTNLTYSGFEDWVPKWMMKGKMMIWFSDRDGMKNRGSWGSEGDVYGMFFTQDAYDRFKLSKADFELLKEKEKKDKKASDKEKKDEAKAEKNKLPKITIDLDGIEDRKARLTIHSSRLSDAVVSPDGSTLYYLCRFEKGMDLWSTDLRTRETKILTKMSGSAWGLNLDKEGKNAFLGSNGRIYKINLKSGSKKPISFSGEMFLDETNERAYIFDHIWRQVKKKFYVTDLHGVDWDFYKKEYQRFLPHINNNHDFAEMLSEMLGELNASHTGCRYNPRYDSRDETACLGVFFDYNYEKDGLRIEEVIKKGPLDKAKSKAKAGTILEKIDGVTITAGMNYIPLLNRKAGKNTLLSFYNPDTKEHWDEVVRPIQRWQESGLLYRRWVENRRAEVERLSNGQVGYVHVRSMNDRSFRTVYEEVLGRNANKSSLIVDTRFNGGGWLHDDLATFLSGVKYLDVVPREQNIGFEPQFKWTKPSVVLVGEGNYSDAHMFPVAYRANKIGKIIGMPVPGTGTAVWWERQIDPTLVFGIPQVGMMTLDGKYLENTQLEPDVKVRNTPKQLNKGIDEQIAEAIKQLSQDTDQK